MIGNHDLPGPGKFRLQHWPPQEAEPLFLPRLAEVNFIVPSDAIGLLQLEHTVLSLTLQRLLAQVHCPVF